MSGNVPPAVLLARLEQTLDLARLAARPDWHDIAEVYIDTAIELAKQLREAL